METIKLWKDNKLDKEYSLSIKELSKGYLKSKYNSVYYNFERGFSLYVAYELNSAFEPTKKDWDLIWSEVKKKSLI